MKIEHMALYVRDLERAAAFYARYFQGQIGPLYENPRTGFSSRFVRFEGGPRLELMTRPVLEEPPPAQAPGYDHISFSVGSRAQVDALTRQLREEGVPVLSGPRVTGDGYYESCVADPEGNRVEITE